MSKNKTGHLNRKLEEIELRNRTYNVLKRGGINLEEELLTLSLDDLSGFKNLSRKDLQNVIETLSPSWDGLIHSLLNDNSKRDIPLKSLLNILKD